MKPEGRKPKSSLQPGDSLAGRFERELRLSAAFIDRTAGSVAGPAALAAMAIAKALGRGRKLLVCGNGGSAADSQHVAAELVVRFARERRAYAAVALTTDSSVLTAESNDHGFDSVFSRQVEALGRRGDVLMAISTSGGSANVLEAMAAARKLGMTVIGLTGAVRGRMAGHCDICIAAGAGETFRVQECHLAIEHLICMVVEETLSRSGR